MTSQANNLGAWTTEQLLAEALARSAEDIPALRLMAGLILRARLAAHDRSQK